MLGPVRSARFPIGSLRSTAPPSLSEVGVPISSGIRTRVELLSPGDPGEEFKTSCQAPEVVLTNFTAFLTIGCSSLTNYWLFYNDKRFTVKGG